MHVVFMCVYMGLPGDPTADALPKEAPTPAAELCVDDYDLRTVAVPWNDFVLCGEEKEVCLDHPDTLLKHCRKTCDTCLQQPDDTNINQGAKCSTFSGTCPSGKVLDSTTGYYCAGNPCTQGDADICCILRPPHVRIEYQGIVGDAAQRNGGYDSNHGANINSRPNFAKFKKCTGTMCEDCHTDNECGWNRSPVYHHLDTVSNEIHVAEYWADCAEGTGAHWEVQTRVIHDSILADDLQEFHNANTSVYLAQEGGVMEGKHVPSNKDFYSLGLEMWGDNTGLKVTTGSTRLYVVINAADVSKRMRLALRVMVTDPPASVADCMDNRMCLGKMDMLRNDNKQQLQCLQGRCSWPHLLGYNSLHQNEP
jgi:hypothetical protein